MHSGMAWGTTRFFRSRAAVLVGDAKRPGLAGRPLFQRLDLAGESVVTIIQIADLVFELRNLFLQLLDRGGLPQNNFDELLGLLAQPLECLTQRTLIAHRDHSLITYSKFVQSQN